MSETIPEDILKAARSWVPDGIDPALAGLMEAAFARAIHSERLARDERAAKIADQRVSNLIDQANEFFEYRDQGSAIIVRERAIEAELIASAIRDRSKS